MRKLAQGIDNVPNGQYLPTTRNIGEMVRNDTKVCVAPILTRKFTGLRSLTAAIAIMSKNT